VANVGALAERVVRPISDFRDYRKSCRREALRLLQSHVAAIRIFENNQSHQTAKFWKCGHALARVGS
jgi:hypothetical protein